MSLPYDPDSWPANWILQLIAKDQLGDFYNSKQWNPKKGNIKLTYRPEVSEVAPIITSAFISHKIRWGDSMTMRWYTNNACRKIDSNGNITFEKIEPKTRKTDGFMAFVAAFIVATKHEDIFEVLPDVDKLPGVFVF